MTEAPPTWLSLRDDRARLIAMLGLVGAIGALDTLSAALIALGAALFFATSAGLSPRRAVRRLWPLFALVAPLLLLTPFWHRPVEAQLLIPSWTWGPTDAGLAVGLLVSARVLAIGLLAAAALDAAPFERTIRALQSLRVPAALTNTALLTYRYLFVFREDLRRVHSALGARGFRPGPNLSTARTYGGVTGGLLVRSLARTERVERAMRCRGYTGALVHPDRPALRAADALLVVLALGVGAALVVFDRDLL